MNILTFILGSPIKAQRQTVKLSAEPADRESLQQYYDSHLAPLAARYETKRVASLKATRQRLYLSLVIVAGLVLLTILGHSRGLVCKSLTSLRQGEFW